MAHFVLDVNETLSDMTPIDEALQGHGAPAGLARTWFASVLRDGFALSMHGRAPAFRTLGREVLVAALAGLEGLDAAVEDVADHALETMGRLGVHADIAPGIVALTDAGHAVSLFTNGAASSAAGLVERAGVLDRVSQVLSVEEGSVWKPHPGAYAYAARALGTSAAELTMVAVHPWDLDGAASAGLRTAWIDRQGSPWPASFRAPDMRVSGLGDLA